MSFTFEGDRIVKRTVKIGTARAGNGTITETDATTTEEYDGQLRLWKVTEPTGGQTADYRYDAAQRLSEVRLTEGTNQSRFFTYDNRGFMTSEQHPETGVITYSNRDARGHAGRRQWGPNDLAFTYDRLERLTQVKETASQQRLLKEFNFATNNAGTNLRRGKLVSAVRHNWIPVPWAGGAVIDVTVSESYTYAGKGGRVSKRTTSVSTGPSFSQEWAYTQFGDVETLTYPRCTQSSCTSDPTSGSPRTVGFGYTRAQLTSVPGYAGSINYHPSGMVNTVAHSNGVNEITEADPAGMRRLKEIRTTGTFTASLGAHLYDGAGNVVARGAEYYLYDAVSRLVRYNTTSTSYQSYAYDSYGNMTSLSFFNGTSTTTRSFSVSTQTNQLTGAVVYDTAGNVTSWGGHTYGYDAFNMQISHDYPDWLHLYTADDERIVSLRYTGTSPIEETYTLRDLGGKALTSYKAVGGNGGVWSWEKDYIYRDGLLLAGETSEPWPKNVQHHVVDHLGTPRLVTGMNGSVVAIHHYFGFGEEIGGGSDPERLRFTGHERDFHEAGTQDDLDYMHARYCSPQLARFMSVDPKALRKITKIPQRWNRYSYVVNMPLAFVDENGMEIVDPVDKRSLAALATFRATRIGAAAYQKLEQAQGIYRFERTDTKLTAIERRKLKMGMTVIKEAGHFVPAYTTNTGKVEFVSGGTINLDFAIVDKANEPPYNTANGDVALMAHEVGHAVHYEEASDKIDGFVSVPYNEQEVKANELRNEALEEIDGNPKI